MSYDPTSEGERASEASSGGVGGGDCSERRSGGCGVHHKKTQEKYFGYYILYIFEIRYACQNR